MVALFLILVFSVVVHEYMHGKIADYLGDPTARLAGRLTLNPLPHIDIIGSVLLPLFLIITGSPFLIGWAKPVPIDPFNLKDPRRDSAIIAFGGPASNLAIALIFSAFLRIVPSLSIPTLLIQICIQAILINISLALLNLLPVAPLDGFKVVGGLLSHQRAHEWYQLERYGFIFLLILILPITGQSMLSYIMGPVLDFLIHILIPSNLLGAMVI